MRPKPKQVSYQQLSDPRYDARVWRVRASYLKRLTLSFLADVEALEANPQPDIEQGFSLREEVRRYEIDLIKYALQRAGGNQTRAAVLLGIRGTTLNSKVKHYRLQTKPLVFPAEKSSLANDSPRAPDSVAFESIEEHDVASVG